MAAASRSILSRPSTDWRRQAPSAPCVATIQVMLTTTTGPPCRASACFSTPRRRRSGFSRGRRKSHFALMPLTGRLIWPPQSSKPATPTGLPHDARHRSGLRADRGNNMIVRIRAGWNRGRDPTRAVCRWAPSRRPAERQCRFLEWNEDWGDRHRPLAGSRRWALASSVLGSPA